MNEADATIPTTAGTYLLEFAARDETLVPIGWRGAFVLAPGWYYYIGSAFGAGGLRARLRHHLQPIRKAHWHVDYLLQALPVQTVTYTVHPQKLECVWCRTFAADDRLVRPIRNFGSGDTRCGGHLFFSRERLTAAAVRELAGTVAPEPGESPVSINLVVITTGSGAVDDA